MGLTLKCPNCHTAIQSRSVHDFRQCKCGDLFVDGGNDYLRYGGNADMGKVLVVTEHGDILLKDYKGEAVE